MKMLYEENEFLGKIKKKMNAQTSTNVGSASS